MGHQFFQMRNTASDTRGVWFLATAPTTASRLGSGYKGYEVTWWESKRVPDKAKKSSMHGRIGGFGSDWSEVSFQHIPGPVLARFDEKWKGRREDMMQGAAIEIGRQVGASEGGIKVSHLTLTWSPAAEGTVKQLMEARGGFSYEPRNFGQHYRHTDGSIIEITERRDMGYAHPVRAITGFRPEVHMEQSINFHPKRSQAGGKRRHGAPSLTAQAKALRNAMRR
jgi:hypothetical protein